jgi:hypothetical protein
VSLVTESSGEDAVQAWLRDLGYGAAYGPDIAAGESSAEEDDREDRDIVQEGRLRPAALGPGSGWRTSRSAEHERYDGPHTKLAISRPSELQSADVHSRPIPEARRGAAA